MNNDTVLFTLAGVLLGGGFTLLSNWINNRQAQSREYWKTAFDLAKEDYNAMLKMAEQPGKKILPVETFYIYYVKYFEIIGRKNFKLQDLDQLKTFREELFQYYRKSAQCMNK